MRSIMFVGLIAMMGCSQAAKELPALHSVTGKVTLNGKILESGQVSLTRKMTPPI